MLRWIIDESLLEKGYNSSIKDQRCYRLSNGSSPLDQKIQQATHIVQDIKTNINIQ